MGRQPMIIPLAVLVAIILICDSVGLFAPAEPPFYGLGRFSARLDRVRDAETSGRIAIAEIDSVDGEAVEPFKVRIHFLGEYPYLRAGNAVRFTSRLQPLPAVAEVPDIVDLQASMRREGVVGSMVVVMDSITAVGNTGGALAALRRLNDDAMTRLQRAPLNGETINMLAAMLLGNSDMLMPSTRQLYSAAGLSHLLALSGMHVAIIALIIGFALWPFYLSRNVKTRLILTAIALWFYAGFTDLSPSVTRSVIMATLFIGGRCLERRSSPLNSLFAAAFLILLFRPSDLWSIGFQMSFAAVLGIILYFPLINRVDRRRHPRLYSLASYPALSVSAMLFTGLIAAYHFHTFPLYFLIANLLAAPLIPLFLISGVVSMTFNIGGLTDFFGSALHFVAELTARIPGAVIGDVYPAGWAVLVLLLLMSVLAPAIAGRHRFIAAETALLALIAGVVAFVAPEPDYPAYEEYLVEEPRSRQLIVREGGECVLFTTVKSDFERKEIKERYSLILRDFMARRGIDSLRLAETDTIPIVRPVGNGE